MKRLALVVVIATASTARAQLASPGDLARGHAGLEGISNCTRCHEGGGGEQISAANCLSCHTELKSRVARGHGFHGKMSESDRRACQNCHHEHAGRDAKLIEWPGGMEKFEHAKTGWPLRGAHAGQKCATCHEARRVVDGEVLGLMKRTGRKSFLGVGTRCTLCHFDEHRGELGSDCEKCHVEAAWSPAPRFDHGKTAFALLGQHKKVQCAKCHPSETDDATHPPFPAPRSNKYLKRVGLAHDHCKDCHADPHAGKFTGTCESCHTVEGWHVIRDTAKERGFHDKTRFPLRGMHASVACPLCHGPFPGRPAKFKNLPHEHCTDCHTDAHRGQLKSPACERCHTVDGFSPVRFDLPEHAQSRFPLEGAHQAVPCSSCHKNDARLAAPAPADTGRRRHHGRAQAKPQKMSAMVFRFPGRLELCETCHEDPHGGQFRAEPDGCRHCHTASSFVTLKFDHGRDSRFALTGKHASAACAACHGAPRGSKVIKYRPIDPACTSCHHDVHAGQLGADCARCHDTNAYSPTTFSHNNPAFTSFALDGKHAKVACSACHKAIDVSGEKVVRYKPLPRQCEDCHADAHHGAFRGFEP